MKKRIILLIGFALVLIASGSAVLRYQRSSEVVTEAQTAVDLPTDPQNDTPTQAAERKTLNESGLPNRITISSVNIDIPVAKGFYNPSTQKWTLSRDKAHFAVMSDIPSSTGGNTYIYGHNRSSVFNRLTRAQIGAEAQVFTDKNQIYTYRLQRTITTTPDDSSMLNYRGGPILTLQTCTGALYQNRTLYVFELIGVRNA